MDAPRRATWRETWLAAAHAVALRSGCVRAQVGCVIVDAENRLIASGYNGPPAGMRTVDPDGLERASTCKFDCPRAATEGATTSYDACISVHAEANALMFCDRTPRLGGAIYVTTAPCITCAKLISNSGLKEVHCVATREDLTRRDFGTARDLLEACGLAVRVDVAGAS